jgi:hypothetical protein
MSRVHRISRRLLVWKAQLMVSAILHTMPKLPKKYLEHTRR